MLPDRKKALTEVSALLLSILQRHREGDPILDRMAERIKQRAEDPHALLGTPPARDCESCGGTVEPGSIRPWACSDRCYADILGIDPREG